MEFCDWFGEELTFKLFFRSNSGYFSLSLYTDP